MKLFARWFELLTAIRVALEAIIGRTSALAEAVDEVAAAQRKLEETIRTNVAFAALRTLDAGDCSSAGLYTVALTRVDGDYDVRGLRVAEPRYVGAPGPHCIVRGQPWRKATVVGVRVVCDPHAWRCESRNGDMLLSAYVDPLAAASAFLGQRIQPGMDLMLNCDLLSAPGAVIPTLVLFTREAPQ